MLGKQSKNTDLFQCVTMEILVPPDHVLRRLDAVLDLSFVSTQVAHLYSRLGRKSVDPEVVVRMWLLQHFFGLSERQLCDEVTMHAGFRWFCGLSFNDPVPDQSTLVKLRKEKWAKTDLWQELLRETVRACEAAGLVRPGARQRLGVDGTQIDANAATVSLEALPPCLTVVEGGPGSPPIGEETTYSADEVTGEEGVAEVTEASAATEQAPGERSSEGSAPTKPTLRVEEGGRPGGSHRSGDPDWHGERFSNATHRSTTDPEARLYRKGAQQEAQLRYLGHYLADLRSGVICGAMATPATGTAEREAALTMLDALTRKPGELAADLGYRDGGFLAALFERGVQPLVPLQKEALEPEPTWQRGTLNLEQYRQRQQKVAEARARNATRQAAQGRRGPVAQRQRTRLEHLFAEAKEHHGLGRAHGRGLTRVDQQVKLTASVQNLKRLLRSRPRQRAAAALLARPILTLVQGGSLRAASLGPKRPPVRPLRALWRARERHVRVFDHSATSRRPLWPSKRRMRRDVDSSSRF